MKHWSDCIEVLKPCSDALIWARTQESYELAWQRCERGDWMLWLLGQVLSAEQMENDRKNLALIACECARLALPYVPEGEARPLKCIETVEAWARGQATLDEIQAARAAASLTRTPGDFSTDICLEAA